MQQKEKWFGESTFNSIKKKKEKLWIAIQELGNKQKHSILLFFPPFEWLKSVVHMETNSKKKKEKKKSRNKGLI